jgi:hypothetical protein
MAHANHDTCDANAFRSPRHAGVVGIFCNLDNPLHFFRNNARMLELDPIKLAFR